MATEQQYDEVIAPKLAEVARLCTEMGMSIVARVEWQPGESGITQVVPEDAGIAQKMTQLVAHSHGNVDDFCIEMVKRFDVSASLFLSRHKS